MVRDELHKYTTEFSKPYFSLVLIIKNTAKLWKKKIISLRYHGLDKLVRTAVIPRFLLNVQRSI
jgi:hypothetical protein